MFGDTDAHLVVSFCLYLMFAGLRIADDRDCDVFCSIMGLRIARRSAVDTSLLFGQDHDCVAFTSCKRTYERNLRLQ